MLKLFWQMALIGAFLVFGFARLLRGLRATRSDWAAALAELELHHFVIVVTYAAIAGEGLAFTLNGFALLIPEVFTSTSEIMLLAFIGAIITGPVTIWLFFREVNRLIGELSAAERTGGGMADPVGDEPPGRRA